MKDDLAHPHDLLARTVLFDPDIAASLFENYLEPDVVQHLDFEALRCESPTTIDPQLNERIGDLRFATKGKDGKRDSNVFFFLEHQSTQDRHIAFRALEQIVQSYRLFLEEKKNEEVKTSDLLFPYPIVVVLYHGKRPWKKLPRMQDLVYLFPGVSAEILGFHLILIDISILHTDEYRGHPVVQALFLALHSASMGMLDENLEAILNLVLESDKDARLLRWLTSFVRYIISLSKPVNAVERVTKVCTKLLDEKTVNQMTTSLLYEQYLEGKEKGREEGKEEGREEGKQELIIGLLENRFGPIPDSLREKLNSKTDPVVLMSLAVFTSKCETLHDFENSLQ